MNNMTPEETKEALQELVNNSFSIEMNANDTFIYACAMSVSISDADLGWVLPIVFKYKGSGIDAVMSFIIRKYPIKELRSERFADALAELLELKLEYVWSREYNSEFDEFKTPNAIDGVQASVATKLHG